MMGFGRNGTIFEISGKFLKNLISQAAFFKLASAVPGLSFDT